MGGQGEAGWGELGGWGVGGRGGPWAVACDFFEYPELLGTPEIFICSIECWSARRLEFICPADTKQHFAPPETLLTLLGPHLNMIGFE